MSGNLLYNNAMKLVNQLKTDLDALENAAENSMSHSSVIVSQVHSNLQALKRAAEDIDDMARREITTVKREKALGRAAQIRDELTHTKARYDGWRAKDAARNTPSDSTEGKPATDSSTILMMDGLVNENEVLHTAGDRLDEFINIGRTALQELYEQRTMLKSTQRRMLDVFNNLGLSTTVIRYIEQRSQQDKWILFGGIAVSIFLMWAIVHYLR
ncbi:protein transport protein bos1 [Dinochytrium kinnereticum]|nr:protein transport protein bos1 [Dinochytrium kinnereticum]